MSCHITPLAINSIGVDTHATHRHRYPHRNNFKNKSVPGIAWQAPDLINGFLAENFDLKGFNSI